MEVVRLPLMNPSFVQHHVRSFAPVQSSGQCLKLVNEAFSYQFFPEKRQDISKNRTKMRDDANELHLIALFELEKNLSTNNNQCFCPASNKMYYLFPFPCAVRFVISQNREATNLATPNL